METSEHDEVREGLLKEGVMDAISLGDVHTAYMYDDHTQKRPLREAQQLTLAMIRELVDEGLFVLGVPNRKAPAGFDRWDESLDAAMARIDHAYVKDFEDRWGWTTFVWLKATDKGKELGRQLFDAEGPWPLANRVWKTRRRDRTDTSPLCRGLLRTSCVRWPQPSGLGSSA